MDGHVLHELAALLLYLVSTPQFVQIVIYPWYFPPGHAVLTDVPVQVYPAVHALHVVRVVVPFPPDVTR